MGIRFLFFFFLFFYSFHFIKQLFDPFYKLTIMGYKTYGYLVRVLSILQVEDSWLFAALSLAL